LVPISAAAAASVGHVRRVNTEVRSHVHELRRHTSTSSTSTNDQTMRWARISSGVAGFSAARKGGRKPQSR